VAGSLTYLDGELLSLLNIPVKEIAIEKPDCPEVVKHCHVFLQATTRFLQAIDEKQQEFGWDTESSIYHALGWMQSLWASRSAVSPEFTRCYPLRFCRARGGDGTASFGAETYIPIMIELPALILPARII
jgi:hypothetical protein